MSEITYNLVLYQPRWHGFARWQLARYHHNEETQMAFEQVLESGWVWRPGQPYRVMSGQARQMRDNVERGHIEMVEV